jgi:hypothetical protein
MKIADYCFYPNFFLASLGTQSKSVAEGAVFRLRFRQYNLNGFIFLGEKIKKEVCRCKKKKKVCNF